MSAYPALSSDSLALAASHSEPFITHAWLFWASAALYLPVIWLVRVYMRSRPPFSLRIVLVLWNTALAILSVIMVWELFPYAWTLLTTRGW